MTKDLSTRIDTILEKVPHLNKPEIFCDSEYGSGKSCNCYVSEIKQNLTALINEIGEESKAEEARYFGTVARLEAMPDDNRFVTEFEKGRASMAEEISKTSDEEIARLRPTSNTKETNKE